jgi:hypothetical protein
MKICHIFNSVIRLQHTETLAPKVVCNGCSKPLSQTVSNMRNDGFGSKHRVRGGVGVVVRNGCEHPFEIP